MTQPNHFARAVAGRSHKFIEMIQVGASPKSGSALGSLGKINEHINQKKVGRDSLADLGGSGIYCF
jgi:hypothetical protein